MLYCAELCAVRDAAEAVGKAGGQAGSHALIFCLLVWLRACLFAASLRRNTVAELFVAALLAGLIAS